MNVDNHVIFPFPFLLYFCRLFIFTAITTEHTEHEEIFKDRRMEHH